MFRAAHCSLYLLCSQEAEREKLISFFFFFFYFLLQQIPLFPLFTATQVPYDPAVPHMGINPEKTKNLKDMGTPAISAQQGTIVKSVKQAKCRNYR